MRKLTDGFRPDDARETVRIVGGLLFALGLIVLAIRRDGPAYFDSSWSDFKLFLTWGLAAVALYGIGIVGRILGGEERRWQAFFTVTGVLLLPVSLFYLANSVDSSYDPNWVAVLIFGSTAALCVIAWLIASVRYQLLIGALFAAIAWIALLDKILSDGINGDLDAIRALLLAFAVALVGAAFLVRKRHGTEPEASFGELLTAAGLVALIAFSLGPGLAFETLDSSFTINDDGGFEVSDPGQDMIWDVLTLVVGAGLILFGVGRGLRGQVYVGGAMMLLFAVSVGADLDDRTPEGKFIGWPLLLIVVGGGALAYSLLAPRMPPALGGGRWFQGGREPLPDQPQPAAPPAPVAPAYETAPTAAAPTQPPPPVDPPTQERPPEPPPPPPPVR